MKVVMERVSFFRPPTITKALSYELLWKNDSTGRMVHRNERSPAPGLLDADSRVFIQLSNLFNVCIHFAMPPSTLQ